jgi:hypothetical protein
MYQVKFTDKQDNLRFGIVQHHHEQAEEFAAIGQSVVEDIITAQVGVIDTARLTEIPMGMDGWGKMDRNGVSWGGNDLNDYLSLEQLAHELRDLFNVGEGVHKNTLFYQGVGDGSAAYVVTAVARSKCTVEWRGFCPDRYVAQPWGYGGSFAKSTVARMIRGRGLFGNQATPDEKLASFKEKYADYLERFNVIPVGMEDILN